MPSVEIRATELIYLSAMLADLTLSTRIWLFPFDADLIWVNLMPIWEPGDFSISIKRGPFEFFIESWMKKTWFISTSIHKQIEQIDRLTDYGRIVFDQEQRETFALFHDEIGLLQCGIQHVYAVYGQYAIADFECSLAVGRSTSANVRHNQRPRSDLVIAHAAAYRKSVRVVLLFQLYVNGLWSNRVMRMYC